MATVLAFVVLAAVLFLAVARPRRLPEAVFTLPAAGFVVVIGLVPARAAWAETIALAPTVGFLAAVLALSWLAEQAGVFAYAGGLAARSSRGSPRRLLSLVFVIASVVTAVLSLDATVVLLTPVVLLTAATLGTRPRPYAYAGGHLANSASLLLPVSNLTNLLAFAASGLSFTAFAAAMAGPWLAVIAVEYVVFRRFFRADLSGVLRPPPPSVPPVPRFALVVLAATLAGFAVAQPLGVAPAWVALAGVVVLAIEQAASVVPVPGSAARVLVGLVRATQPGFCLFVFGLGIVVLAARRSAVGAAVARLMPNRADLVGLLVAALVAAVLANLMNNLPATLMLVPPVAGSPGLVLAVLLGVNIGPNLTYAGSLATLLWRRVLQAGEHPPRTAVFLRLGALTVPLCLLAGVVTLWLATVVHSG